MKLSPPSPSTAYPVEILKNANGTYTARVLDLPTCPVGFGSSEDAAREDLINKSASIINKLQNHNAMPPAVPRKGYPTVVFGLVKKMVQQPET